MATLALSAGSRVELQQTPAAGRWYKGNTHTHTLNSDGDSTPDDVVRWYREHGYQFLVLTDHNFLTSRRRAQRAARRGRAVPRRQRRGSHATRSSGKPLHVNGLDVQRARRAAGRDVGRRTSCSATSTPSAAAQACRTSTIRTSAGRSRRRAAAGQQQQAVRDLQRPSAGQQPRRRRRARARGSLGRDPLERHAALRHRRRRRAQLQAAGQSRRRRARAAAGSMVRAPRLEARALLEALERGDFYASTGVELTDYQVDRQRR